MTAISVRQLHKTFPAFTLKNVSFDVQKGTLFHHPAFYTDIEVISIWHTFYHVVATVAFLSSLYKDLCEQGILI